MCICYCIYSQNRPANIYENLSQLYTKNKDSVTIEEIVEKYNSQSFTKIKDYKSYRKFADKTLWLHFKASDSTNIQKYFTIKNPYLSYGKVYVSDGNKITKLHRVCYYREHPFKFIFYRYPTWKIDVTSSTKDVFFEIKNPGGRSNVELFLESENDFLKRVQIECILIGLFLAFLASMAVFLLFFSILKKEYSVIFYSIYIVLAIIEFLAGKGLGIQFIWSDSMFLINNTRSISQTLGAVFIGSFYYHFYKLKRDQKIPKLVFKLGVFIALSLLFFYVYKYFFGGLITLFLYVWIILKIIALAWLGCHIYLIRKKQIPFYLVFAFILPILALASHQSINLSVDKPNWLKYLVANQYYIALVIEILLFTRYILYSVIKTQQKYFKLKSVTEELQNSFKTKTLEIQQEERNHLVSNVHDTFGGYLEALKIRLLNQKNTKPEKVQEILDSFYKDYRYLLNSLYSPKINSENFIENLIEFCDRLNQIIDSSISHRFSLDETSVSQEKCLHIYQIISELVTNAIKHANASKINVSINEDEKNILVKVSDNGIGFHQETNPKSKGFGLQNIKKRVASIKGRFEIDSNNLGTTILITTPKNE